jgi:hypothetical protein
VPPSVLLRHDLPDGTHHYDWMLQRPGVEPGTGASAGGDPPLRTFRLPPDVPRWWEWLVVGTVSRPVGSGETGVQAGQSGWDRSPDRSLLHFSAASLSDHRAAYLTYEGPVSGDRGSVRRLWTGHADWTEDAARGVLEATLTSVPAPEGSAAPDRGLASGVASGETRMPLTLRLRGERSGDTPHAPWRFEVAPASPAGR